MEKCSKEGSFTEMIPITALTGDGVELSLERLTAYLTEGEPYFPKDQITDQPERFLAGEIIREKVMAETRQEVPHAVAVRVEDFEEGKKLIRIRCEHLPSSGEGQKANPHRAAEAKGWEGHRHGGAPGARVRFSA